MSAWWTARPGHAEICQQPSTGIHNGILEEKTQNHRSNVWAQLRDFYTRSAPRLLRSKLLSTIARRELQVVMVST